MNGIRNTVSAVGEVGIELVMQVGSQVSEDTVRDTFRAADLEEKYEALMRAKQLLSTRRNDIEDKVQRCREKDTTSTFSLWITEASEADEEANELLTKYEAEVRGSRRVWLRPSLSSEMERMIVAIRQLEKRSYMVFPVDKPPERVLKVLNAIRIAGYPTIQGALEKVLELVKNSKIKAIGFHGLKGLGKTAIMRNLNNHEEVAKLFDIVFFAGVSDDDETHLEIQQKFARRLKMDTKGINNDPEDIATKIHEVLKNKKYLLILEGIVDSLDLTQLGIPNNDNYSKFVLAAQHQRVLYLE